MELVSQAFRLNPSQPSPRRAARELGISRSTLQRRMKDLGLKPYKPKLLLQAFNEDDPDRRLEFCEWILDSTEKDQKTLLDRILWTDEATFQTTNGRVNRHNCVFVGVTPIHTPCDRTRAPCPTNNREGGGVWSNGVVGPFFFEGNVTSDNDLQMLEDSIIAELEKHSNFQTMIWQQEGAPPHDGRAVREYLDIIRLPNGWVVGEPSNGQRGLLILLRAISHYGE